MSGNILNAAPIEAGYKSGDTFASGSSTTSVVPQSSVYISTEVRAEQRKDSKSDQAPSMGPPLALPHINMGHETRRDLKEAEERFLGIHKYKNLYRSGRSYNYEEKYDPDKPGEEAGPNARVFKVYLDEAESYDNDMVQGFRDTIDALLVFAALFSAVVTTFAVETSKSLRPDYAQISVFLLAEQVQILRAGSNATAIGKVAPSPIGPDSITHSPSDVWVNGLIFTSLALSLSVALLSVLVKQWLQAYMSLTVGTVRDRALVRHLRFRGVMKWKLHEIVGILPLILHASLAAFLAGLSIFVYNLRSSLAWAVIAIAGGSFLLYTVSVFLSALWLDCPYRIPLLYLPTQAICLLLVRASHYPRLFWSGIMHIIKRFRMERRASTDGHVRLPPRANIFAEKPTLSDLSELKVAERSHLYPSGEWDMNIDLVADALFWLHGLSSNATISRIAAQAVCGIKFSRTKFNGRIWISQLVRPLDIIPKTVISTICRNISELRDEELPGSIEEELPIGASIWLRSLHVLLRLPFLPDLSPTDLFISEQRFLDHPFSESARRPDLRLLRYFLTAGANINGTPNHCPTALYNACYEGRLPTVKFLVQAGVDFHNPNYQNFFSPLRGACFEDDRDDIVQILLEVGGFVMEINSTRNKEDTALELASERGHLKVARKLLGRVQDIPLDLRRSWLGHALLDATYYSQTEAAELLIHHGADINFIEDRVVDTLRNFRRVWTPLQHASYRGSYTIVKFLLENGARVDMSGQSGLDDPIEIAQKGGHSEVVQLLRHAQSKY